MHLAPPFLRRQRVSTMAVARWWAVALELVTMPETKCSRLLMIFSSTTTRQTLDRHREGMRHRWMALDRQDNRKHKDGDHLSHQSLLFLLKQAIPVVVDHRLTCSLLLVKLRTRTAAGTHLLVREAGGTLGLHACKQRQCSGCADCQVLSSFVDLCPHAGTRCRDV